MHARQGRNTTTSGEDPKIIASTSADFAPVTLSDNCFILGAENLHTSSTSGSMSDKFSSSTFSFTGGESRYSTYNRDNDNGCSPQRSASSGSHHSTSSCPDLSTSGKGMEDECAVMDTGLISEQSQCLPQYDSSASLLTPAALKRKRKPLLLINIPLEDDSSSGQCSDITDKCRLDLHASERNSLAEVSEGGSFYAAVCKKGNRQLEDACDVRPEVDNNPNHALFAVFDGHGGQQAAKYAKEHLGASILNRMEDRDSDAEQQEAIAAAFKETDADFCRQEVDSGASAVTIVLKDGKLYAANAGDCRAVLSRGGQAEQLTYDHRPSDAKEKARIEQEDEGIITGRRGFERVQNRLGISRGIGDYKLKKLIISEPHVQIMDVTPDCEFVVLASDGLWDAMSNDAVVAKVRTILGFASGSAASSGVLSAVGFPKQDSSSDLCDEGRVEGEAASALTEGERGAGDTGSFKAACTGPIPSFSPSKAAQVALDRPLLAPVLASDLIPGRGVEPMDGSLGLDVGAIDKIEDLPTTSFKVPMVLPRSHSVDAFGAHPSEAGLFGKGVDGSVSSDSPQTSRVAAALSRSNSRGKNLAACRQASRGGGHPSFLERRRTWTGQEISMGGQLSLGGSEVEDDNEMGVPPPTPRWGGRGFVLPLSASSLAGSEVEDKDDRGIPPPAPRRGGRGFVLPLSASPLATDRPASLLAASGPLAACKELSEIGYNDRKDDTTVIIVLLQKKFQKRETGSGELGSQSSRIPLVRAESGCSRLGGLSLGGGEEEVAPTPRRRRVGGGGSWDMEEEGGPSAPASCEWESGR
eukprot:TRINITY_DN3361_c0_g1_i1.p1 TRINITY_DN3361_c0_g1~~TRINITY_DN3361_c0_g1_i1.p1  ORF type:complete len:810 (+),score=107.01 TRINITY_DN3361_c0_g1_i1:223-2652(+)